MSVLYLYFLQYSIDIIIKIRLAVNFVYKKVILGKNNSKIAIIYRPN